MAKRDGSVRRGATGRTGARGERGADGERGQRGKAGARGPAGPAAPSLSRADVLAMVEDQFIEIRMELSLQLTRMGQIQSQLDQIHAQIKKLVQASS